MQIIHTIITFILIFITLYSYGFAISNKLYKHKNLDIFFIILVGYVLVGTITLILHFFLILMISFLFSLLQLL